MSANEMAIVGIWFIAVSESETNTVRSISCVEWSPNSRFPPLFRMNDQDPASTNKDVESTVCPYPH